MLILKIINQISNQDNNQSITWCIYVCLFILLSTRHPSTHLSVSAKEEKPSLWSLWYNWFLFYKERALIAHLSRAPWKSIIFDVQQEAKVLSNFQKWCVGHCKEKFYWRETFYSFSLFSEILILVFHCIKDSAPWLSYHTVMSCTVICDLCSLLF